VTLHSHIISKREEDAEPEVSVGGYVLVKAELSEQDAHMLESMAAMLAISVDDALRAAVALMICDRGSPIPPSMAAHLEAIGIGVPRGAKVSRSDLTLN
jgi:hypothetical protein